MSVSVTFDTFVPGPEILLSEKVLEKRRNVYESLMEKKAYVKLQL